MQRLGLKIILCGGDRREIELYRCWKDAGIMVKPAGFELSPEINGAEFAGDEDFAVADVLVAPLSGIKADGGINAVFSAKRLSMITVIEKTKKKLIILAGSVAAPLKERLERESLLLLTGKDEELALLNAVPTAEGAIQKAMELSPVTLHGSRSLIFGLGRCGTALAGALRGLGAKVAVVVRRRESAALACMMGLDPFFVDGAAAAVAEADFIFNTVPAPLLTAALLQRMKREAIILDLATAPGGTDFAAAAGIGLTAVLLPGLPGIVAPRTAGKILARVYRRIIKENQSRINLEWEGEEKCQP